MLFHLVFFHLRFGRTTNILIDWPFLKKVNHFRRGPIVIKDLLGRHSISLLAYMSSEPEVNDTLEPVCTHVVPRTYITERLVDRWRARHRWHDQSSV